MKVTNLQPLGDQAALAWFPDEAVALRFAAVVRQQNAPWLVDVVQAYASVAVFFDAGQTNYAAATALLRELAVESPVLDTTALGQMHEIPCCYELALDLQRVTEHTRLSPDDVIRLHTEAVYTVYAIG